MQKAYASHEGAYQKMVAKGIECWDQFSGMSDDLHRQVEANTERFFIDVLAQSCAPRDGRVLELGCGTGPILRWFNDRGFTGLGVDISPTAIDMARAQSAGRELRFQCGDVCDPGFGESASYDLVVDGHCLHCIMVKHDRRTLLENVRRLLKPGGLLIVSTMCGPVNRKTFKRLMPEQVLHNRIIYAPWDKADEYEGARQLKGRLCHPIRYLGHWKEILTEIRRAGFRMQLFRYANNTEDEPVSGLEVAALALK